LVYRENDRIMGTIQLDKQLLSASGKNEVFHAVQEYLEDLSDALSVYECDVQVAYSNGEQRIGLIQLQSEVDWQDQTDEDSFTLEFDDTSFYELITMNENRNWIDYHLLDENSELIAEVSCRIRGREVSGTLNWAFDPLDEEVDAAIDLLVADFNEEDVDVFVWDLTYQGNVIDTIELTHTDLLGWDDSESWDLNLAKVRELYVKDPEANELTIVLIRNDGDLLTYEIYQQSHGGLPIGTATIDISERQLSGFIDFRENLGPEERSLIAQLLMEELDKEKDYETLNVSMMYGNAFIDEILLETDYVH
jgi:hypothetical protein